MYPPCCETAKLIQVSERWQFSAYSHLIFSQNFSLEMLKAVALRVTFSGSLLFSSFLIALFMLQITDLVFEKLPCLGQQSF
jgi:hypothetical protein